MEKYNKLVLLLAVCILIFLPEFALAAEEGGHGGNQLADLGWRFFNFLLFIAIIYFAAAKPIRNFLNGRIEGIRKELGDAEKGKEEAEKKLNEYLERLATMEDEVKEIHDTLRREGEVERSRIIEAAEEAAKKMKTQAAFSATQELNKAIAAIKKETAEAAVALAEKVLKKDMKKEDQKRLVGEYLESLGDLK